MKTDKRIYLIAGVPGSGKTWLLTKLEGLGMPTIHYDSHFNTPRAVFADKILTLYKNSDRSVFADCPLGISEIMQYLQPKAPTTLCCIVNTPETVSKQFFEREGKPIPKQHLSRIKTVELRAVQYEGIIGTSSQLLEKLRCV